jgi:glucosamine--fructose-6-phosphate aminotransferase (isomerizing)
MHAEAREAPDVVANQLTNNDATAKAIGARLRDLNPHLIMTCGRGTSDCAGTYAKYLIETRAGVPVADMAASVSSIYNAKLKLSGAAFIAISQSGKSPDLLSATELAKAGGAYVVALVNDETSPLAALADSVLPLRAGAERSVAATKSFIASLSALAHIAAHWLGDDALLAELRNAPKLLRAARDADWSSAIEALTPARNLFVLGRGFGFAAAQEAALKLKETCGLHAEAYSSAEVRHGPMAIIEPGFPLLALQGQDAAGAAMADTLADFTARGARMLVAGAGAELPLPPTSAELEPLAMIQAFYPMASALALARGFDPDAPPSLRKITETR